MLEVGLSGVRGDIWGFVYMGEFMSELPFRGILEFDAELWDEFNEDDFPLDIEPGGDGLRYNPGLCWRLFWLWYTPF